MRNARLLWLLVLYRLLYPRSCSSRDHILRGNFCLFDLYLLLLLLKYAEWIWRLATITKIVDRNAGVKIIGLEFINIFHNCYKFNVNEKKNFLSDRSEIKDKNG